MSTEEEAKRLISSIEAKGYTVALQVTDQSTPSALKFIQDQGFIEMMDDPETKIVELKDSLPDEEQTLRKMSQAGVTFVFSLHGPTEELHSIICDEEGNFGRVLKSIEEAKKLDLRVFVNTVVHKGNYRSLVKLADLLVGYQIKKIRFLKLISSPRAMENMPDLFLTNDELVEFYGIFEKLRKEYKGRLEFGLINQTFGPFPTKLEFRLNQLLSWLTFKRQSFYCRCGTYSVCVHPHTLDIYQCRFTITNPSFVIGKWNFEKGIIQHKATWFKDFSEKIGEPCRSCRILARCGGYCRAQAISNKFRLTGEFDIYSGFENCPVALGIYKPLTWSGLWNVLGKVLFFLPKRISSLKHRA